MATVRFAASRRYEIAPGTSVSKPMLRVRLGYAGKQTPEFPALLDSGADRSVFHADLAIYLGIDLAACRAAHVAGIGGHAAVHLCSVDLEVERVSFAADVMFSAQIAPTVAVLGRDNVFDLFQVGFDQRSQRVLFDRY